MKQHQSSANSPTQNSPTQNLSIQQSAIHVYPSGVDYSPACGRYATKSGIQDRLARQLAVIDLDQVQPTSAEFLKASITELRLRFYQPNTIRNYQSAIVCLLRWFGRPIHLLTRQHVRQYLEFLIDAGQSSSAIVVHIAAIRTMVDKFCYRDVTLGLATPRGSKKLPLVLSKEEVTRLLQAADSLRDKLLLGLLYATGMRLSEVVRLRFCDLDFDRNTISIWEGKGRADRIVTMPESFRPLLQSLGKLQVGKDFLFPSSESPARHLSTRTVQRIMTQTRDRAGISKPATPHTLRHSFATHSFENGCDIRLIQRSLGHVDLETTTIYIHIAKQTCRASSPLDALVPTMQMAKKQTQHSSGQTLANSKNSGGVLSELSTRRPTSPPVVGGFKLHMRTDPSEANTTQVAVQIDCDQRRFYLTGTRVRWDGQQDLRLQIPTIEQWEDQIRWLNRNQQDRIREGVLHQKIRQEILKRLGVT